MAEAKVNLNENQLLEGLPDTVFISHAYDDAALKNKLLRSLPKRVKPIVFPRLEPDQKYAVSNGIVEKILGCGALIYLDSERSRNSLWVNFERDYALRSKLKVFSYNDNTESIEKHFGDSVSLSAQLVVGQNSIHLAERLLEWLKRERSLDLDVRPIQLRLKEIPDFVASPIHEEEVVLWFLDEYVGAIAHAALDIPLDFLHRSYEA